MAWVVMKSNYLGIIFAVSLISIQYKQIEGQYDSISLAKSSGLASERGKQTIKNLFFQAEQPKYGICWKRALSDLNFACKFLDTKKQSRMAITLTSCFLEMLGFPPLLCDQDTPIQDCARDLDERGYNTFLEYFLHIQDMCVYLSSQTWQQQNDKTINKLVYVAAGVAENISKSRETQEKILCLQKAAVEAQKAIKIDNESLYSAVVRIKELFDAFTMKAYNHRTIFEDIFKKITKVQNLVLWVQGQFSMIEVFVFYISALIIGIITTATQRTRNARFWLILLFLTTLLLERIFVNLRITLEPNIRLKKEQDFQLEYLLRRLALLVGTAIVCTSCFTYKDYKKVNISLLADMQAQLEELSVMIEACSKSLNTQTKAANPNTYFEGSFSHDILTEDETYSSVSISTQYSHDSESVSSISTEIDIVEKIRLLDEVEEMYPDLFKTTASCHRTAHDSSKRGIPYGPPLHTSTPKQMVPEGESCRYNLRPRNHLTIINPIINEETPTAFAKRVSKCFRETEQLAMFLCKRK